jgi:hypothetical protein
MKNLRRTVLEYLADHGRIQLKRGKDDLIEQLRRQDPSSQTHHLMRIFWHLLSEGLLFIDYTAEYPSQWDWRLSERGLQVAKSQADYEPEDPERYLETLKAQIPNLDEQIFLYAKEALGAYSARCYLASTVMLGVASERAFQLLGEAFASWLPSTEEEKFRETFDKTNRTYVDKFEQFRKRIEPRKSEIPSELSDNMALTLDSVLDLLRINRNDAGHPTGKQFDREETFINLQIFARYLKKLYAFKEFFLTSPKLDFIQSGGITNGLC